MKKKKENKKIKTNKSNKSSKKIVSRIINIISIIVLAAFLYFVYKSNLVPTKYYKIMALSLLACEVIYTLVCINKKASGALLKVLNIIAIIFIIIESIGIFYINKTINFLDKNTKIDYEIDEYYLVTNTSSTLSKITELDGGSIYYYVDTTHLTELKSELKKKTTAKIEKTESLSDSLMKLSYPENVVLLNSGTYDSITENDAEYASHLKVIDKLKVKIKKKVEKTSDIDVTNTPFTIYLSGIDTRGTNLPARSLSDVNMFIVVNPKTKHILIVSIPRDSYVTLHGIGAKDKLTHAGSLGGVELSKATVEDMLGYPAHYYARVNFKAVTNIVDTIGGVTVDEDASSTPFKPHTDKGCTINPGKNILDGRCALAFARERYHYSKGDFQRNINQQKVLTAVFEKITSSTSLVTNYTGLLNAVSGSFETSLSTQEITSLVKFQLNDMSKWKIDTYGIQGTTGRTTTYASPSTELSVVYPNAESVEEAKAMIKNVLEETKESVKQQ